MSGGVSGIVWMGPAYDRGGYGAVTRNYLLGLSRIGFPVRLLPYGAHHDEIDRDVSDQLRSMERARVGNSPALVVHGLANAFVIAPRFGFVRRIGCTIFETDRIPDEWVAPCNSMDEVWVPSQFNVQTFSRSGVSADKLAVVPYGIDAAAFRPSGGERGSHPFTFLYVCAFNWRKGLDLLLESFLNEFRRGEARLVMRVYSEGYQGVASADIERVLYEAVEQRIQTPEQERPEVEIITRAQSPDELKRLYESANLYISTDRANGWGVPCQEAMALGVPAATIDWSGSTEFMRADNSVLIHPTDQLEPVDQRLADAVPELYAGHRWAHVESAEVRRAMRWALSNPRALAEIAEAGRRSVSSELGLEDVARRAVTRLSQANPSVGQRVLGATHLYTPWAQSVRVRLYRDARRGRA